jgi:iron(III) transport system substrate-binding protein
MLQIIHTAGNEDAGWPLFHAMFPDLIVTGSAGAVSRGAAAGEYASGMTPEDNAQRSIDGGAPVRTICPAEGIALPADAMALIRNGPNPEAIRALMDCITSPEAEAVVVDRFGRRPIRDAVAPPANVPAAADLPVNNPPPRVGSPGDAEVPRTLSCACPPARRGRTLPNMGAFRGQRHRVSPPRIRCRSKSCP